MNLLNWFKGFTDSQYSKPRGFIGMFFGEKMVRQHQPETLWTIKLLKLHQNENILELGCGAGYAMKLLLRQSTVSQVIGLDISKSVLQSAKLRNRYEISNGRASLIQGDVKQLPFQDEYFTKIFSIQSVYFWESMPETISEIYRVLKPEGSVVITLSDGKDGEKWDGIKNLIENQIVPIMEQSKFRNIELIRGPDSRQYKTVSIKGDK